ncbi:MAG: hypothetical protein J1F39_02005 [Clostridiales bacterium]|nr:hypothetical protein [Clostridiales bacterium]
MKLKFLGTAAAEGVPAVFCNCDNCKRARLLGGKDIRTRSQILIDADTLFDFPMDTYMHALMHGVDLSAVKHVLISHSHMDHCYPQEFIMRGGPFAHELTEKIVEVICNDKVREMFLADTAREIRPEVRENISVTRVRPFERLNRGDMTIIPLPAAHTANEECLVYYVERGGVGALLLNDTGVLDGDVYARLYDMGGRAKAVTFDCTYGVKRHGPGRHMGLLDDVDQAELLLKKGVIDSRTKLICTHLSHNNAHDYAAMQVEADPFGFTVAYDGMEITI